MEKRDSRNHDGGKTINATPDEKDKLLLILKRPVGNFMASLLEVEEVVLGVVRSLGLFMLQQLIQLLHQTLPLLPTGLYHLIKASFFPS
jgi:hypothetical protein